jgi:hypothetical protein
MPYARIPLDHVWIDDQEVRLAIGTLTLERDDPMPDVHGLKSWSASLAVEGYPLADISRDRVRFRATGDGRRFAGDVYVTNTRVSSATGIDVTLQGTGPLDGFDDSLLD